MGLRDTLRMLRHKARQHLDFIELADGSRHWYTPEDPTVFLHMTDCLRAQSRGETTFPEPPPVVKAIARAKDRTTALDQVFGGNFYILPYEREALVERGEFVPRSMVAGRELGETAEDLSE